MTPATKKEAILSLYQQGQKYSEIADFFSLSPNTVKSICRRSGLKPKCPGSHTSGLCRNCGTPLPKTHNKKPKTFCCDQCRYDWWNKQRRLKPYRLSCCYCGREFVSFGNKNRKFCGRECYLCSRYGEGLP